MNSAAIKVLATTLVMSLTLTSWAQPPEGGPPRGRGPGGPQGKFQGKGQQGGRPGFELGTVIPPHMRGDLDLSEEQENQVKAIEKEVKAKLEKILTKDQIATLSRPPMGGGGPGGPEGRPRGRGGPGGPPDGPEDDDFPPAKKKGGFGKKGGPSRKPAPPQDNDN